MRMLIITMVWLSLKRLVSLSCVRRRLTLRTQASRQTSRIHLARITGLCFYPPGCQGNRSALLYEGVTPAKSVNDEEGWWVVGGGLPFPRCVRTQEACVWRITGLQ